MSYSDKFNEALEKELKKKKKKETSETKNDYASNFTRALEKEMGADSHPVQYAPSIYDDDIAPVAQKGGNKDSIFKSGGFSDGVDSVGDFFGDLGETILGTTADLGIGMVKGAGRMVEGLVDLGTYGVAKVADALGADDFARKAKETAKYSATDEWTKDAQNFVDQYSVLGNKADMVSEGLGQVGAIILTGGAAGAAGLGSAGVAALTTGVTGLSSMGTNMGQAYDSGATDKDAFLYGLGTGAIEAGTELLFGGLGKTVKALGISRGIGGLDDIFAKKLSSKIVGSLTNESVQKALGNTVEYAVKSSGEGLEEVLSGLGSAVMKKLTYEDDESLQKLIEDENLLEQFVVGAVTSSIVQGGDLVKATKSGTDFVTGQTAADEKVVSKVVEDEIARREKAGETLSTKDKNEIYDAVVEQMEHGQIDIDTIEEVLGGDAYKAYKDTVESEDAMKAELSELRKMKSSDMNDLQVERMNELKGMNLGDTTKRDALRKTLDDTLSPMLKDSKIAESYRERERRTQKFEADLSKYTGKQRAAVERAVKSGVLNNTYRSHELVDVLSKIEAEKGIVFDYTNNENLKESGFAIEGKTINGFANKNKGTVTLNVQSNKAWQSVVGHEITHVLENTEAYSALRDTLYAYAESKGELEGRRAYITALYQNMDADIEAELTADMVGDYLFSDKDFVKHLTGNRTMFQKIYDEIKYLWNKATGKEKTEIEKVKDEFDRVWKEYSAPSEDISDADDSGEADIDYSVSVTDKDTLDSLNEQVARGEYDAETNPDGGYYVTYKSMSFWGYDDEGNAILRSPMAEYVDGELSNAYLIPEDKSKLNWYQATETIDDSTGLPSGLLVKTKQEGKKSFSYLPASENQDLINEDWSNLYFNLRKKILKNGKWVNSDVPARYNPYEHSSNSMLNDQFTAAYQRDNLVTVKMYVPISEDNGAYRAKWSKDPTGWSDWKSGIVAGKIAKQKDLQRRVYLSRYAAPVEIVPDSEVAQAYKGYLEGTDVAIPDNVVSPNLLSELRKAGVPIEESGKVQYSISEIVDENNNSYGMGVKLDSTLLDNLSPEERVEMVKERVKDLGGAVFTAYDPNGNAVDVTIAESSRKFKNKSGRKVPVNKDMTAYLANPVKQEAIVLVDELITASSFKGSEPATHPHDWVDNNGKNDWDVWETYIQDKEKTVWKAKLRIANSTNGEKILYDVFPIEKVGGVKTLDTAPTDDSIAPIPENVNTKLSISSDESEEYAPVGNYSTPFHELAYGDDIAPSPNTPTAQANTPTEQTAVPPDEISPMTEEEANAIQDEKAKSDAKAEGLPKTRKQLHSSIINRFKDTFSSGGYDFDEVLSKAKDLSTFSTVDNTPQRVMEKALGYKEGQILADLTVNKVAQNETEGIKWLNSYLDRKEGEVVDISKEYRIKPGSKESAAAQMYAEGFYVNDDNEIIAYGDEELAKDFPDADVRNRIKGLASDQRIRRIYDETLDLINESRKRNAYPEIPRLENYYLHFRAMEDTFSRMGLPFNPNDIKAKDLPTDLNGVTADLKPGQPYFASAMHRKGKRTSFDLLGGLERYLTSAKNQIYHIDDIQNLRALRNYIADTYGQANGLEGIDALDEEAAQQRIEQVYGSHLSTFAKFLNEEANILAGKTALIDRGLEGIVGRRAMTFMNELNKQVGSNMVGYNISSSMTNFLPVAQAFAKGNKGAFVKAFAQTVAHKVSRRSDGFAENSPVMIRRKGADRFHRTPWQKMSDPGYALMGMVDSISTELIARTKYNELVSKGMDSQTAHYETDKWVSRLMGDRSIGQQPQLYNSKALGIITKFQLEVRNQLDSQFYDTIQEAKVSNEHIQNELMRNAKTAAKVTSTVVQLAVVQHLFGKAFESVAGYNPAFDIIEVMMTALGFDDEEDSEDTALDNLEQGFFALLEDLPYTSTLTGGRIPISSALPVTELVKGVDSYGNEKSRWETLGEAAPYYVLPGGYGQIKKTAAGLNMFSDEHPVTGSYTDSGKLRFPVEDTPLNRVQAAVFGQYASKNAREYFDNGYAPLGAKQIQEYIDVDMPIKDYWEYREGLNDLAPLPGKSSVTLEQKLDYVDGLDLPTYKKNILVNNITDRKDPIDMTSYGDYGSLEEFDFATKNPEKYAFAKSVGGYSAYQTYSDALYDIKADKDASGKTINGSRKEKVLSYINNLDADYYTKILLWKSEYPSDDTYNREIIDYINGLSGLSYTDRVNALTELGFRVTADGQIYAD